MTILNLDQKKKYHPLIVATEAILKAPKNQEIQIVMSDKFLSKEIKNFLIAINIGFREIYNNEQIIIQFHTK